jgi:hypothetical protein
MAVGSSHPIRDVLFKGEKKTFQKSIQRESKDVAMSFLYMSTPNNNFSVLPIG